MLTIDMMANGLLNNIDWPHIKSGLRTEDKNMVSVKIPMSLRLKTIDEFIEWAKPHLSTLLANQHNARAVKNIGELMFSEGDIEGSVRCKTQEKGNGFGVFMRTFFGEDDPDGGSNILTEIEMFFVEEERLV